MTKKAHNTDKAHSKVPADSKAPLCSNWLTDSKASKDSKVQKNSAAPISDKARNDSQILVLASNNQGKIKEFQAFFDEAQTPFTICSQSAYQVPAVAETALSFLENAILKARHAAKHTQLPALADDSGLSVPVLGGAPGIYSARYAGTHGDDAANNQKLLDTLTPHRGGDPVAGCFVCALALVSHENDPLPLTAVGLWHGEILPKPRGAHGFGYDPLFWLPDLQKSSAELAPEQKNRISHRARALTKLLSRFNGSLAFAR